MSQSLTQRFLAFCRSKPADERYDYYDASACAITQFAREVGFPHLIDVSNPEGRVPDALYEAVNSDEEWTFGALADRLSTIEAGKRESV